MISLQRGILVSMMGYALMPKKHTWLLASGADIFRTEEATATTTVQRRGGCRCRGGNQSKQRRRQEAADRRWRRRAKHRRPSHPGDWNGLLWLCLVRVT
jgi:hypothetical protein